jgi:hypothetical protein
MTHAQFRKVRRIGADRYRRPTSGRQSLPVRCGKVRVAHRGKQIRAGGYSRKYKLATLAGSRDQRLTHDTAHTRYRLEPYDGSRQWASRRMLENNTRERSSIHITSDTEQKE